jgi:tricorn protease
VVDSKEGFVMRKTVLVTLVIMCAVLMASAHEVVSGSLNEPIRLMRRPDINGGRIVFMWAGDLWMVSEEGGQARRLTVHEGTEDYPKFSPDGKWIAFSGDMNERSNGICLMSADGDGEPVQLTYHAAGGYPVCWTRDGKSVIFSSTQESFVRFFTKLFRVPVEGGLPVELEIGKASYACYSPDGSKIAYNRHPDLFWWWKRYKGSMNQDIWIYDFKTGQFTQITDWEGTDAWPMWTGNRIYFASDRTGEVNNIFYYDLATKETKQITKFEKHGVQWPSMSADGKKIVFEREARLYVLDVDTGEAREVKVFAPLDARENMVSYISPTDMLRGFDLSPSAKRIVFDARGEIYTMPVEHGDVRNLTESSGSRDTDPAWSPDGKWIVYVSDKSGDDEVYLVDQMGKEKERRLTSNGHFKSGTIWSPNSDKLLYTTEENALYLLDVKGGEPKLIAKNEHRDITNYSWSPDGRWIAYDFAQRNRNRDIFIYDVKTGENHQVTTDLGDDYEPVFVPDGKYLLLITARVNDYPALARVSLLPEDKPPFEFPDDEETGVTNDKDKDSGDEGDADKEETTANDENGKEKAKDKKAKGKEEKKPKKPVETKIDFTGIEARIRRLPKTAGLAIHNVQATEKYYYYLIQGQRIMLFRPAYDLYMFNVEKIKSEKIASSIVTYGIAANREKLAIYDGSDFNIVKVGAKTAAKKTDSEEEKTKFDFRRATRMKLDRAAEWHQIFNESWRVVKYLFYDPNLHGVNWDEVGTYYESLLPYVQTRGELNILLTEMVGELNASHQNAYGGDMPEVPRASMGFLGAKVALDEKSGFPRILKIYQGDKASLREKAPLDAEYIKVKEGDYLLAIDGHELKPGEDFNKYLVDKTTNKITITTNSKPEMKGAIETTFTPLYSDVMLQYLDWVDGNTKYVDEKSGGRIGYMHLADMQTQGWNEFREKFEKFRYKDAIIIDVRYNGGGSIDERIIDYLERRPYQYEKARNQSVEPRPTEVFTGEVVVLINEYSFSDAEVFPSAVKERGLGTLVGVPTLGFVIAVTGHQLIDGGTIRKTFIGIWEKSTGKQLESKGVMPDILVDSPPEMEKQGRDVQLEKAVEFLMGKIATHPNRIDFEPKIEER